MKKILSILIYMLVLILFTTNVSAGHWRKGKRVYKNACMSCHKIGGQAKIIDKFKDINKKTKSEWTQLFNTGISARHSAVWSNLNDKEKDHILSYFKKYSSEKSDKREDCRDYQDYFSALSDDEKKDVPKGACNACCKLLNNCESMNYCN